LRISAAKTDSPHNLSNFQAHTSTARAVRFGKTAAEGIAING
jgi:hypothetical protein